MRRLRTQPPDHLARFAATTTDLLPRADALIFTGGDADMSARVVVRPSGTEPKVKCYIEVRAGARRRAVELCNELSASVQHW
jgi:phosphomannomutase